jgi:hypothetical protein
MIDRVGTLLLECLLAVPNLALNFLLYFILFVSHVFIPGHCLCHLVIARNGHLPMLCVDHRMRRPVLLYVLNLRRHLTPAREQTDAIPVPTHAHLSA